jgi:16S rRNA (guanine966-N2)-methyltransferase
VDVGEQRVRVIAGTHGGRRLNAPPGQKTRPTSDRVREALFSRIEAVLGHIPPAPVLDLFAGSGALGIEALSRGASNATFVERDRAALATLRSNLDGLQLASRAAIIPGDVVDKVKRGVLVAGPFALLFLDPPYRIDQSEVRRLIELLMDRGLLVEGALVVWEHSSSDDVMWPEALTDLGSRRYGDTTVSMSRLEGGVE